MTKKMIHLLVLVLVTCQTIYAQDCKTPNGFQIRTGVNLGVWLSQSDKRGTEREQFIVQSDFDSIAKLGFDHIRLPIDEVQFWDEKGNKLDDAFKLIHKAVNWAIEASLRVIIDLHIIRSHYFNAKSNPLWEDPKEQEKLVGLWGQLSEELKKYPNDMVAYELMNEAVAKKHEDWNELIGMLIKSLRKNEASRTIVVGSNEWQKVHTFPYLKVPKNDKNIILSFHFYKPFALTHYQASWLVFKDYKGPVNYPGMVIKKTDIKPYPTKLKLKMNWAMGNFNKKELYKRINSAIKVAKELDLPLFCGEFGVIVNAPRKPALQWYSDITDIFRENNIAYCHWAYKGIFPLVDENSVPLYQVVDILVKK